LFLSAGGRGKDERLMMYRAIAIHNQKYDEEKKEEAKA
jgi:hypothetical protein